MRYELYCGPSVITRPVQTLLCEEKKRRALEKFLNRPINNLNTIGTFIDDSGRETDPNSASMYVEHYRSDKRTIMLA